MQTYERAERSALVLYGTETGNAQDIAYELGQCLERLHITTVVRELDASPLQDLLSYSLVVVSLSTTGQGDFPANANKFWSSLRRKKLTATSLAGVRYALVGLCDSSYPKFNLAARKLNKRLQQLGASPILDPCEADEQGEDGTEGAFSAWLPLFRGEVLHCLPLPEGTVPIPSDQRLPSRWLLAKSWLAQDPDKDDTRSKGGLSTEKRITSLEPTFEVTLKANERVTPTDHWQDVRLITLETDQAIQYMPGDALAIRPENCSEDVEQIINILGWQDAADDYIRLQKNPASQNTGETFDSMLDCDKPFTLRHLLTKYLDIKAIPRRSFFAQIANYTDDEMQKDRALEFTDPQFLDEYFDYATRPRRSILEVLQEFDTVRIPWQEAINVFPFIRPRQFSVASGGRLKAGGQIFELLVAIVKYRTVIKRIREGLCTKYLATLPIGSKMSVTLHTGGRFQKTLSDLNRPHLLIGGGTGIAPLRSIIHEKANTDGQISGSMLVFGCRNARADYFFQNEWASMTNDGHPTLRVIPAFSRDQTSKIYIQDRLRENAPLIRDFLADPESMVIVCGSSGAMPKAVRQALHDVLCKPTGDNPSQSDAEDPVSYLEKSGRYKQETW